MVLRIVSPLVRCTRLCMCTGSRVMELELVGRAVADPCETCRIASTTCVMHAPALRLAVTKRKAKLDQPLSIPKPDPDVRYIGCLRWHKHQGILSDQRGRGKKNPRMYTEYGCNTQVSLGGLPCIRDIKRRIDNKEAPIRSDVSRIGYHIDGYHPHWYISV